MKLTSDNLDIINLDTSNEISKVKITSKKELGKRFGIVWGDFYYLDYAAISIPYKLIVPDSTAEEADEWKIVFKLLKDDLNESTSKYQKKLWKLIDAIENTEFKDDPYEEEDYPVYNTSQKSIYIPFVQFMKHSVDGDLESRAVKYTMLESQSRPFFRIFSKFYSENKNWKDYVDFNEWTVFDISMANEKYVSIISSIEVGSKRDVLKGCDYEFDYDTYSKFNLQAFSLFGSRDSLNYDEETMYEVYNLQLQLVYKHLIETLGDSVKELESKLPGITKLSTEIKVDKDEEVEVVKPKNKVIDEDEEEVIKPKKKIIEEDEDTEVEEVIKPKKKIIVDDDDE